LSDTGLDATQTEVAEHLARAKLAVAAQEKRILKLKRAGLPTDSALDTLDALNGTVVALATFSRLLDNLQR